MDRVPVRNLFQAPNALRVARPPLAGPADSVVLATPSPYYRIQPKVDPGVRQKAVLSEAEGTPDTQVLVLPFLGRDIHTDHTARSHHMVLDTLGPASGVEAGRVVHWQARLREGSHKDYCMTESAYGDAPVAQPISCSVPFQEGNNHCSLHDSVLGR